MLADSVTVRRLPLSMSKAKGEAPAPRPARAFIGCLGLRRARATDALALMKVELERQPDNPVLWASLCLAHALLGDKDETLRDAKKSAELLPESRDAIVGPQDSGTCAIALAWIGEKDRALAGFERLLRVPWGLNIYPSRLGWRPLRDDPRFKALVSDPKNNEPLL